MARRRTKRRNRRRALANIEEMQHREKEVLRVLPPTDHRQERRDALLQTDMPGESTSQDEREDGS